MEKNTTALVLTRITLGITLLYIGWLFNLFESSSSYSSAGGGVGIIMFFLYPYLTAVVIAALFNIIISFKESINEPLNNYIRICRNARSTFFHIYSNNSYYPSNTISIFFVNI